jgi:hypothetical protein
MKSRRPVNSDVRWGLTLMTEHDPRCEGPNDQKLLDDVAEHGWHVIKVIDQPDSPGWAYSVGLFQNFRHPEIVVFGLDSDLMHSIINTIGDEIRSGNTFEIDHKYADLIDAYLCTFKRVAPLWRDFFLAFASWFYNGTDYPVRQCFWPDFDSRFPWESNFSEDLISAQPLLFNDDLSSARVNGLVTSLEEL